MLMEELFPDEAMSDGGPAIICYKCGAMVNMYFTDEHLTFHEAIHDMYLVGRG